MLAIIRIRGNVGVKKDIRDTLEMLNLKKVNTCTIIPETPNYLGMLKKVKDFVTWGTVSKDNLKKLIEKRGFSKKNEKITEEFLKENKLKIEEIIENFDKNKKEKTIKPYFRLTPPSKGFKKSIKQHYPKGALGNRKEEINELLKKMM